MILSTVGVAGMKLQLNSRTVTNGVHSDTEATPPRPVSAKVSNHQDDQASFY